MTLRDKHVAIALTGSFCTFDRVFIEFDKLVEEGASLYPIFSIPSSTYDTRFGKAEEWLTRAEKISGKPPVTTIIEAEKFGPSNLLDVLIIAPCTGNTMAKLAYGITDSPVLMAAKGHLRNHKPVVLAISTNDALGANMKNLGLLMNTKNIYFVPYGQDNYKSKPYSMVAHFDLMYPTILEALQGKQLQPVLLGPK